MVLVGMLFASVCASAQLKVAENGNIGIQLDETPLSAVSIGATGAAFTKMTVFSNNNTVSLTRRGTSTITSDKWRYGLVSWNHVDGGDYYVGLKGWASYSTPRGQGRAYGVYAQAGNSSSGYNYGVYGLVGGTQNGTGIYGTATAYDANINGRYAGYFYGDVKVTGNLYGTILTEGASANAIATQSIQSATDIGTTPTVTEQLSQLNAVQYNLPVPVSTASLEGDTANQVLTMSTTEMQALEKNHYGLMAAQLQQVYPDLVYENQQGDLCINYIEMIPLLVESIKELKAEITQLKSGSENELMTYGTRSVNDESPAVEDDVLLIPALEQNNPNPFTENTVIGYTLPEEVNNAVLYIYNMNGNQVDELPLPGRGKTSVTISGGKLTAGMYLYSLVADGKVIDTKRMILTK